MPVPKKRRYNSTAKRKSEGNMVTLLGLFNQFPIVERLCSYLDIGDIVSLTRTCKRLSSLYQELLASQWNVDRHLQRFVNNPVAFRIMMADCDALVSGSLALQFFERTTWSESDLDVYVNVSRSKNFRQYLCEHEGYVLMQEKPLDDYRSNNELVEVHTLNKKKESGDFEKIQVVSTKSVPLLSILRGFWTTVVVNFFSWQKAYSIFPQATFIERRGYMLKDSKETYRPSIFKYSGRGWDFQDTMWPKKPQASDLEGLRRGGDRHSWVIQLRNPKISYSPETDRPLAYATLSIKKQFEQGSESGNIAYYTITAEVCPAGVLRYSYVYAPSGWSKFFWTKVDSITWMELLNLDPSLRPKWVKRVVPNQPCANLRILQNLGYSPPAGWTYRDNELPKWFAEWEALQSSNVQKA